MQTSASVQESGPAFMSASTLIGDGVCNLQDEDLGKVKEIRLDIYANKVAYAVSSLGGFLGMGQKLIGMPLAALKLDTEHKRFTPNVEQERLDGAPGFDKESWPDMACPV